MILTRWKSTAFKVGDLGKLMSRSAMQAGGHKPSRPAYKGAAIACLQHGALHARVILRGIAKVRSSQQSMSSTYDCSSLRDIRASEGLEPSPGYEVDFILAQGKQKC